MKRIKPNIIDIFVVFAVFLILATTIFRWINLKKLPLESEINTVVYTISIYNEDYEYNSIIKVGDELYLYDSHEHLGEVIDTKYENTFISMLSSDGTETKYINPARINITLKVKLNAKIKDNGFYTKDNTFIFPGYSSLMNTNTFAFEGQIEDVVVESK